LDINRKQSIAGISVINIKLLGLLVIVLIISSGTSLAASSASTLTQNGNIAYSPLADSFPFSTPTPTPSPSPEPTVTPIPTPRPEPTAKPTLKIDCKSSATESNLKVAVTGTLTYNKTAIPGASIFLSFSSDSGNRWENFSLVQTRSDGGFGALWIPNATGNYLLNAQWEGNSTLHWTNTTVNLALMPDSAGNIFSVASNSTISNLNYTAAIQTLSFTTNGTSSTTGYVHVCIPKTLVKDIQTLEVNKDGKPIAFAFSSEDQDDIWLISCLYTQSEHVFMLQIPFIQMLNPATTPWIVIVIALAILIALVAIVVTVRRRRRTAATIASILKQNRPVN
jgi:hypothetical protein